MSLRPPLAFVLAALIVPVAVALGNTSHAGWPKIQHRVINKSDADTTLTGVPGLHNELLGGHGNDTINGADAGDVLWGDYKPTGQPTTQVDHINAGAGNDFVYASHGTNFIYTGAGTDMVHAHFGGGAIHCGSATDIVFLSHVSRPRYKLYGCRHISYKTVGY